MIRGPLASLLTTETFKGFKVFELNQFKMLMLSHRCFAKQFHIHEPVSKFTECWQSNPKSSISLSSIGLSLKMHLLSDKIINKNNFSKHSFSCGWYSSACMTAFSSSLLLLQPTLYPSKHVTSAIDQCKMKYCSNLLSFHALLGVWIWLVGVFF